MIQVTTPIGVGCLVGKLQQAGKPDRLLVSYKPAVLQRAVELGLDAFLPYRGGPSVLFAWAEEEVKA